MVNIYSHITNMYSHIMAIYGYCSFLLRKRASGYQNGGSNIYKNIVGVVENGSFEYPLVRNIKIKKIMWVGGKVSRRVYGRTIRQNNDRNIKGDFAFVLAFVEPFFQEKMFK